MFTSLPVVLYLQYPPLCLAETDSSVLCCGQVSTSGPLNRLNASFLLSLSSYSGSFCPIYGKTCL